MLRRLVEKTQRLADQSKVQQELAAEANSQAVADDAAPVITPHKKGLWKRVAGALKPRKKSQPEQPEDVDATPEVVERKPVVVELTASESNTKKETVEGAKKPAAKPKKINQTLRDIAGYSWLALCISAAAALSLAIALTFSAAAIWPLILVLAVCATASLVGTAGFFHCLYGSSPKTANAYPGVKQRSHRSESSSPAARLHLDTDRTAATVASTLDPRVTGQPVGLTVNVKKCDGTSSLRMFSAKANVLASLADQLEDSNHASVKVMSK